MMQTVYIEQYLCNIEARAIYNFIIREWPKNNLFILRSLDNQPLVHFIRPLPYNKAPKSKQHRVWVKKRRYL